MSACLRNCLLTVLTILVDGATIHAEEPSTIEVLCLDEQVLHGATFQSNNQKVVFNKSGIFVAYVKSRNAEYTAQTWRVLGSRDGGKSFKEIATGVCATNPPVLETDADDNLYLGRVDWVERKAYIDRYLASENYEKAHTTELPGGAAGKYAMALDSKRKQLVFFSHNDQFFRVSLDGKLLSKVTLLKGGTKAVLQYPHLCFDELGNLYAAWTTVEPKTRIYYDIHVIRSKDGGEKWETLTGDALKLPIIADDGGPTQRLTLDDEFEVSTWLCNMLARHGKLHAMYMARTNPARFQYLRYDLKKGREDMRVTPEFRGKNLSLNGLDGTFSSRLSDEKSPLVAIVREAKRPRLAALRSNDQGATWHDLAASKEFTSPYAISGCRELTPDGYAIGIFTDAIEPSNHSTGKSKLYFYRVRVEPKK